MSEGFHGPADTNWGGGGAADSGEFTFVALHFLVVLQGGEEVFEKFRGVRKRVSRFFISYFLLSWFRPLLSQPFRREEMNHEIGK